MLPVAGGQSRYFAGIILTGKHLCILRARTRASRAFNINIPANLGGGDREEGRGKGEGINAR